MGLGEVIQTHRVKLRLSQAALAQKVGVRQATISEWEGGKSDPSPANMNALAEAFGVAVPELRAQAIDDLAVVRQMTEGAGPMLPAWMEQQIVALEREATRAGANDEQLDYIDASMRSHAAAQLALFDEDGSPRDRVSQERHVALMIESVRAGLKQILGSIGPDLPADAKREPQRPMARKGLRVAESDAAQGKKP